MESQDASFRAKRFAAFAALYLIWGSTYLAIRVGVGHFPPALFAAIRFLICAPLLLAIAAILGGSIRASRDELIHSVVVGVALLVGGNFLLVWAQQFVSSGLACLIAAGTPIWMTGMEQMRRGGERVSAMGWAGIAVGFLGVALLIDPGTYLGEPSDGRRGIAAFAEVALVASSVIWSAGSIYSKGVTLPKDSLASTAYQTLFGGLALAIIALVRGEYPAFSPGEIPWKAWAALAYLVVFGSILGLTAYVWLIRSVPAAQVSTYAFVNPIVALALGYFVLDEEIGLRTLLGMAVILTGIALVSRAKVRDGGKP